ncbi:LCP family protein [uncultured Jatrophihabitans sp.]|uniref:LCP family protein n=1 Tax=uncultured Jatrophihabitans sp. TaxID=1610747 RepID=UPI0035CC92BF
MSYEPLPPHLDPRGRHRGGSHGPRAGVARPLGRVLGALLSVTLLLVAGYYWYTYREINNKVPRLNGLHVGAAPSGSNGAHDIDGKDQNILLVGNDDRSNMTKSEIKALHAGESSGSLATDTMIIIHVPANGSKATLISVPRDSYVDIKGFGKGKVNGAYADAYYNSAPKNATPDERRTAGANLLVDTLQDLTGLTINHYVQVDLLGFYRISNAIGGVTVNLCHAVDDSHQANVNAGLSGGSGLVLSKGKHTIKGVTALEFVRQRHFLPRGDLDRVRRQQYFLTAAFRQVASVGILTKLRSLGDAVEKSVYLDPGLNLTDLGSQLQNLRANNIVSKTIPTTNATIDGQDVEQVNKTKVQSFIDKLINPAPKPSATPGSPGTSSTGSTSASTPTAATSTNTPIDSKCIN